MPTTNSQSGDTLVGATGLPTDTNNSSASASNFWNGLQSFSDAFHTLIGQTETALNNAGIITTTPNPSNTSDKPKTTGTGATNYAPLMLIGALVLGWYLYKKAK